MTKFIELIEKDGQGKLFNIDLIKYVEVYKDKVVVGLTDGKEVFVIQSYEDVKSQILQKS